MAGDFPHAGAIDRVLKAIETVRQGGMVIMVDDENRENEGDLVFAAEDVDSEKINFMAKEARGLICLPLSDQIVDRLKLPMMGDHGKSQTPLATAFTVSIEAREGVSTGISAADRARTIQVAISDRSSPSDIVVPGHVFPLKAKQGGVLERAGHTEGSVDLARLAGKKPAAVICEIMRDDGKMARMDDLTLFAKKFELPIVSIEDLIQFRILKDQYIQELRRETISTDRGEFIGIWYENTLDQSVHFALVKNPESFPGNTVEVRVHKQRPLVDVFLKRDPKLNRLEYALQLLAESDRAAVLYLTQSDPQQAIVNEDFKPGAAAATRMDPRLYGVGAQILRTLGVQKMNLHVSSERGLVGLAGFGLEICESKLMG